MKVIYKNQPLTLPRINFRNEEEELVKRERLDLTKDVFALFYLGFIILISCAIIFEIKNEYNIDLIPGINTPFDDVYFNIKNSAFGNPKS